MCGTCCHCSCSKSKSKPRLLNETQTPSYTGWTADEIQRLREGTFILDILELCVCVRVCVL